MKNFIVLFPALVIMCFVSCNQNGKLNNGKDICCNNTDSVKTSNSSKSKISIYEIGGKWTDSHGVPFQIDKLKGKVQVIAMIYTHCKDECPRIVGDIKDIQSKLSIDAKNKVGFVLVSFDSERDTTGRLKEYADEMGLGNTWILLHGDEESVRNLSMVLDVKYQRYQDGDFSHDNVITILDTNGAIIHRQEGLGEDDSVTIWVISKYVK